VRGLLATVLLLVGALLVPVSTTAWWLRDSIVPTDGYVDTVAPLATDPDVLAEVEDRFAEAILRTVTGSGRLDAFPQIQARIDQVARTVAAAVVERPEFADAWRAANRAAHRQLVAILSGDPAAVQVRDGTVDVRIASLADTVRDELAAAGLPFAEALPRIEATVPIGTTEDVARAQRAYTLLDRWGAVLPFVTAVLLAVGLLVARRRSRALRWTSLVALLGLGVTFVGVLVGREIYLRALPDDVSRAAGTAFFDIVTSGLRQDLAWVALGAAGLLVVGIVGGILRRAGTAG
jgi:hypothetical protein